MEIREITVGLEQGLHSRPATQMAKTAARFRCEATLSKNGETGNVRNVLELLCLEVAKGDIVTLRTKGPDKKEALSSLAKILAEGE